MQLSKHYEEHYSFQNKFGRLFSYKQNRYTDLQEQLRERKEDYTYVNGTLVETHNVTKNAILHCRKIQRSKYIKYDDNVLNLRLDNEDGRKKGCKDEEKEVGREKPLTIVQIFENKKEIKRVQIKYVNQDDIIAKRRQLMNSKIIFATSLYNLRMKGQKITNLSKYTNDVIRGQGGINCRDDVLNLMQKV